MSQYSDRENGASHGRKLFGLSYLPAGDDDREMWQRPCPSLARTNMRKAQTIALEFAQAPSLAWVLLSVELAAAIRLLSSGLAPEFLVRCLRVFLRF